MPYTPPTSRSPAASYHASPVHTPGSRPQLPHSNSSASYLQRHRRSPSVPNLVVDQHQNNPASNSTSYKHANPNHDPKLASVRQSPPPIMDRAMPAGAILSPPDSAQNSDEESTPTERHGLKELQEAVRRSLDGNRNTGSPQNEVAREDGGKSPHLTVPAGPSFERAASPDGRSSSPSLSKAARKISHSRSATESSFFDLQSTLSMPSSSAQSDESDEDAEGSSKPPLLRKKSGELVKPAIRPTSRRKHSSMPGTPTFSKAVHFNEDIEQVRHFLQVDRPIAVSAGASPVDGMDDETEFPFALQTSHNVQWELRLKNFPRDSLERLSRPIHVERLYLSPDQKSLLGIIAVANLAFNKSVVARFTLDYWKTTSEVVAEYDDDKRVPPRADGYDRFKFSIKLSDQANLESRTLLLCMRYNVNGQEFWDNNDHMNYQVDFTKKEQPVEIQKHGDAGLGVRPIPRSRHNSAASRPRSVPSFEDDFSHGFESEPIKFRNTGDTPPRRRQVPGGAQFSTRYDFGASLSAALSHAQEQLGDRSGLQVKAALPAHGSSRAVPKQPPAPATTMQTRTGLSSPAASTTESPRPDALLANRQSLDSRAYQEFVSKYCFVGSQPSTEQSATVPGAPVPNQ